MPRRHFHNAKSALCNRGHRLIVGGGTQLLAPRMDPMSAPAKSRVCFVSGGASGLGRATAIALARQQYRIAVADRDEAAGRRVVEEIIGSGGEAAFFPLDVTRETDVSATIDSVVS